VKYLGVGGDAHTWEECQCPQEHVDKIMTGRTILALIAAFFTICLIAIGVGLST
jgi:hypothetical protein